MKRLVGIVICFVFVNEAWGAQNIKVLLARENGSTSQAQVRTAFEEAKGALLQTGIVTRALESAANSGSLPTVYNAGCFSSHSLQLLDCARLNLEGLRNQHNADIVLMVGTFSDLDGRVPPEMIGLTPSLFNQDLAYAVVARGHILTGVPGHEIGHLLSLEHVGGDSNSNSPFSYNHPARDADDVTIVGRDFECIQVFGCTRHREYSRNGSYFPDGGAAGNSSTANAYKVLTGSTWDIVAAYRPFVQQACNIAINFQYCQGGWQPNYTITPTSDDVGEVSHIEIENILWGTGEIDDVFDGGPTCPGAPLEPSVQNQLWAYVYGSIGVSYCTTSVTPSSNVCNNQGQ